MTLQSVGVVWKSWKHYAQQLSKVSEWMSKMGQERSQETGVRSQNGTKKRGRELKTFYTWLSKCVQNVCKTENGCAQWHSKVSELFENLENITLNGYPKCRSAGWNWKWEAGGILLGAPVVGPALWIYSNKVRIAESRSDDRRSQEWAILELAQWCPNCVRQGKLM